MLSYLDYWQKNVKRCNAGAIYNGDEMAMQASDEMAMQASDEMAVQASDEMAMHCIYKLSLRRESAQLLILLFIIHS